MPRGDFQGPSSLGGLIDRPDWAASLTHIPQAALDRPQQGIERDGFAQMRVETRAQGNRIDVSQCDTPSRVPYKLPTCCRQ
jgi:hypothetical protein